MRCTLSVRSDMVADDSVSDERWTLEVFCWDDLRVPGDDLMAGVPPEVVRVQEVLAARSRMVVLRQLLDGPRTFGELHERVDLSAAGVRAALADLAELGYVSDDSPGGRQRKAVSARFMVDRELVLGDVMSLAVYLLR